MGVLDSSRFSRFSGAYTLAPAVIAILAKIRSSPMVRGTENLLFKTYRTVFLNL